MSIQSKLAFVCALLISPTAFAEDLATATDPLPPGTFTSTQHSDEWKIKNALSAGPPWITDNATVVDMGMTMSGGKHKMNERVIRPGTNGWKYETTMKWMTAVMEGRKPNINRVGLSYLLLGEGREGQNVPPAKDRSTVKDWYYVGPHVMIVLPDDDMEAFKGLNEDLSRDGQYISSLNHSKSLLWVIPVAKGGARIHAYRPTAKTSASR